MDALCERRPRGRARRGGRRRARDPGAARSSPWSTRDRCDTDVPPRPGARACSAGASGRPFASAGTILEASVRVAEPRPEQDGFDERAWLARQGIHAVLDASSWQGVGRRAGLRGWATGFATGSSARSLAVPTASGVPSCSESCSARTKAPADVQTTSAPRGSTTYWPCRGRTSRSSRGIYALGWLLRYQGPCASCPFSPLSRRTPLSAGSRRSSRRGRWRARVARLARLAPSDRWHFLAVGAPCSSHGCPRRCSSRASSSRSPPSRRSSSPSRGSAGLRRLPRSRASSRRAAVALACGAGRRRSSVPLRRGTGLLACERGRVLAAPLVLGLGLLATLVEPDLPQPPWPRCARGWAAAWLAAVARVVADLPSARIGTHDAAVARAAGAFPLSGALPRWVRRCARRRSPLRSAASPPRAAALGHGRPAPPEGLRVTFIDVGQGDSVLLEMPEGSCLVDQGPLEATSPAARGSAVAALRRRAHAPQRDHAGGAGAGI